MLEHQLKRAPSRERGKWLAQLRDQGKLKKTQVHEEEPDDEPRLFRPSLEIWGAFGDLSSQRPYGQHGPQPITLSEILSWTALHYINKYDVPFVSDMLIKMDRLFLENAYANIKKEREKAEQRQRNQPIRRGR